MSLSSSSNVERAAEILIVLSEYGEVGLNLAELSSALNEAKPAVHRSLVTLSKYGFVQQISRRGRYALGSSLFGLAMKSVRTRQLVEMARPFLIRSSSKTNGTSYLVAKSGLDAICLDLQEGLFYIPATMGGVGRRQPFGLGAASICMLSAMDEKSRTEILSQIYSRAKLSPDTREIISSIRFCWQHGYSTYRNPQFGEVVNIAVSLPIQRFKSLCAIEVTLPEGYPEAMEFAAEALMRIVNDQSDAT